MSTAAIVARRMTTKLCRCADGELAVALAACMTFCSTAAAGLLRPILTCPLALTPHSVPAIPVLWSGPCCAGAVGTTPTSFRPSRGPASSCQRRFALGVKAALFAQSLGGWDYPVRGEISSGRGSRLRTF